MKLLTTTIARIIFALPFAIFGIGHLTDASSMAGYVPIPGGVFWVYLTGAAMLAASICIIAGKLVTYACFGLALLMLVFIITLHIPGLSNPNPQMSHMAMGGLLKDMGLMGGALLLAGIYDKQTAGVRS